MKNNGDLANIAASNGFNGKSKCTWQLLSTDTTGSFNGGMGPTFKLKSASVVNYLFYWAEWITTAGLGTNGVLPTNTGAAYHIGSYPTADGVWLNPASNIGTTDTGAIWGNSAMAWAVHDNDPEGRIPGSIGNIIYYSRATGPFKAT